MAEEEVLIEVTWENQPKAQAKLRVQSSATLRDMHSALVGAKPVFESKEYTYMYEGKPIFREFWDVFEARNFDKKLYMRPGSFKIKFVTNDVDIIAVPKGGKAVKATAPISANPPAPTPAPISTPIVQKPVAPVIQSENKPSKPPAPQPIKHSVDVGAIMGGIQKNIGNAAKPTPAAAAATASKPASDARPSAVIPQPAAAHAPAVSPPVSSKPQADPDEDEETVPATKETNFVPPTSGDASPQADAGNAEDESGPRPDPSPSQSIKQVKKVEAVFSYKARSVDQLSFHKGDVMEILIYRPKGKWWFARLGDKKGWIPHNFVKVLDEDGNPVPTPSGGEDEDRVKPSSSVAKGGKQSVAVKGKN